MKIRIEQKFSIREKKELFDRFREEDELIDPTLQIVSLYLSLGNALVANQRVIINAITFALMLFRDLNSACRALVHSDNSWDQSFHVRSIALQLYEGTDDIPKLFGKTFREEALRIGTTEEEFHALGAATKQVAKFHKENHDVLKKMRTIASAHRDHDAVLFEEVIHEIGLREILVLTNAFRKATVPVVRASIPILSRSGVLSSRTDSSDDGFKSEVEEI